MSNFPTPPHDVLDWLTEKANQPKAEIDKEAILRFLEKLAKLCDEHDIVVPELSVKVGAIEISLSGKKLEDTDASKRIEEKKQS